MSEKIPMKQDNPNLGNYALYIQGEKYPRAVFMNKTHDYAIKAAKILSATPLTLAIPNPNAKDEVIRAEIENYFYVKNLIVRKIPSHEEARRLKQGILNNAMSKRQKLQVQNQQIQHKPQQKPIQNQKPAIQKLSTKDIVAQAIEKIQHMQKQMQQKLVIKQISKPQQKPQTRQMQKPQQQKQNHHKNIPGEARSIQDEIRRMIREELSRMKR